MIVFFRQAFLLDYTARFLGFKFEKEEPNQEKEKQLCTEKKNVGVSLTNLTGNIKQ